MFGCLFLFATIFISGAVGDTNFSCSLILYNRYSSTCVNLDLKIYSFDTNIERTDLKGSETIAALYLTSKLMFELPRNLFSFFPNVTEIAIVTPFPQITQIQERQFKDLSYLQNIFIVGQRLRFLRKNTFEGAPGILGLFLPSNQIEHVHENAFSDLVNCKFLMLSNNRIETLENATFSKMKNLWSVNLSNNQLVTLNAELFASNQLTILDLSYNKIRMISRNITDNFVANNDQLKLLSMKGNICDKRIYTKSSSNVAQLMRKCFIAKIPDDQNTVESLRKKLAKQILENFKLQVENKNLQAKNSKLLKNSDLLTADCDATKCLVIIGSALEEVLVVLKDYVSQMVSLKSVNQKQLTSMQTFNAQAISACPSKISKVNGTIDNLENKVDSSMALMMELKAKNLQLSNLFDSAVGVFKNISSKSATCYASSLQSAKSLDKKEEIIGKLQTDIEHLEATIQTLKQKNPSACNENSEISDTNELLVELNKDLIKKDAQIKEMGINIKMLKTAAQNIKISAQEENKENFELKSDNADCETLLKVDEIEEKNEEVRKVLEEKDKKLEDLLSDLKKSANNVAQRREKYMKDDDAVDWRRLWLRRYSKKEKLSKPSGKKVK